MMKSVMLRSRARALAAVIPVRPAPRMTTVVFLSVEFWAEMVRGRKKADKKRGMDECIMKQQNCRQQ
jgi:hypothetical protein